MMSDYPYEAIKRADRNYSKKMRDEAVRRTRHSRPVQYRLDDIEDKLRLIIKKLEKL